MKQFSPHLGDLPFTVAIVAIVVANLSAYYRFIIVRISVALGTENQNNGILIKSKFILHILVFRIVEQGIDESGGYCARLTGDDFRIVALWMS